jgi:hypothetical protein
MTAIAMQQGSTHTGTLVGRSVATQRRSGTVARTSLAGVALAIATLATLVAMLPGLAHRTVTDVTPRGVPAPVVVGVSTARDAQVVNAGSDQFSPVAVPGPHPTR